MVVARRRSDTSAAFWDEPEWASYLIANHPVVGVSYYEAEAYAAFGARASRPQPNGKGRPRALRRAVFMGRRMARRCVRHARIWPSLDGTDRRLPEGTQPSWR